VRVLKVPMIFRRLAEWLIGLVMGSGPVTNGWTWTMLWLVKPRPAGTPAVATLGALGCTGFGGG